jgi:hypothetical protein
MRTFSSQVGRWSALLDRSVHAAIVFSPCDWRVCFAATRTSIHLFAPPSSSISIPRMLRAICIDPISHFWANLTPSCGSLGFSDSQRRNALMISWRGAPCSSRRSGQRCAEPSHVNVWSVVDAHS